MHSKHGMWLLESLSECIGHREGNVQFPLSVCLRDSWSRVRNSLDNQNRLTLADAVFIQALFATTFLQKLIISPVKTDALKGNWKLLICYNALKEHLLILNSNMH